MGKVWPFMPGCGWSLLLTARCRSLSIFCFDYTVYQYQLARPGNLPRTSVLDTGSRILCGPSIPPAADSTSTPCRTSTSRRGGSEALSFRTCMPFSRSKSNQSGCSIQERRPSLSNKLSITGHVRLRSLPDPCESLMGQQKTICCYYCRVNLISYTGAYTFHDIALYNDSVSPRHILSYFVHT